MSNNKKQNKNTNGMNTLDDILNSEEFNNMFDIEKEQEELKEAGWTYEEIKEVAKAATSK